MEDLPGRPVGEPQALLPDQPRSGASMASASSSTSGGTGGEEGPAAVPRAELRRQVAAHPRRSGTDLRQVRAGPLHTLGHTARRRTLRAPEAPGHRNAHAGRGRPGDNEGELGAPVDELFASFDPVPLGSASIGRSTGPCCVAGRAWPSRCSGPRRPVGWRGPRANA